MEGLGRFPLSAVIVLAGAYTVALAANPPGPARITVLDGVYSAVQAAQGRVVYEARCGSCHLPSLAGGMNESPALKGASFLANWDHKPLRSLYGRILTSMPLDDPGSLSDQEALAIVAYLLSANGYPASSHEPWDSADSLDPIEFVKPKQE